MIKTARQLKDLIRNLSKDKSADAQILMRNYMMERFLERVSLSEYRDKFILKGGMLVAAMVGLDARSTMDIDATVKGATVGIEEVENMIASITSVPVDDGVEFRLKRISEIMDEAEYPGIRVSMETEFDGVITPLKIDISTGDAITAALGGHVEFVISKPAAASEYVTAGSLIPVLALSTERYTGNLADAPTLSEIGDYENVEVPVWRGVAAPAAMSDAAAAYWSEQLGKVAETDTWKNDYLEKNKLIGNYMDTAAATEYVTTYEKDYMTANGIQ